MNTMTVPAARGHLHAYRAAHEGQLVIVCGCGSSLRELSDPQRFITIGVNDVGRLFDPTYLVVVNPRQQFKGDRFRYIAQSKAQALFSQLDLGLVRPPVVRFKLGQYGGTDIGAEEVLHYTQNSPYVAVCLAAHMGARRIGLIGVDFTDDHFFAATGRHPLSGRLREIDAQYGRLAAALARRGIELVNLGSNSRLASLRRLTLADLFDRAATPPRVGAGANVVSYSTTPVAGVPSILARCISAVTPHRAHCVWATGSYGNGARFGGGTEWSRQPQEASALLQAADVVIVHNGKVDSAHRRLLAGKRLVTMAHNYGWNVDMQHVRRGQPGVVVGQYQATLPEFAQWRVVPNPVPLWEREHSPGDKSRDVITIAYTPSGRHNRYPVGHKLYWHSKGWAATLAVLHRLARTSNVLIETTEGGQVEHSQALAMKQRAHIVIDECVTGSYHRNSLEGLAAGAVVVNGVGLLPDVEAALLRCAPDADRVPFVFSTLDGLEETLRRLIAQGPAGLIELGRQGRAWLDSHWRFDRQWETFWDDLCCGGALQLRPQPTTALPDNVCPTQPVPATGPASRAKEPTIDASRLDAVSVVVPHGSKERLPQLATVLALLRQRTGVREIIVAELGATPVARRLAARWADKHVFVEHNGPFERARALNAAQTAIEGEFVLWHDNDLLVEPEFIVRALREVRERNLDFLIPFTCIHYLDRADSECVMRAERAPADCRPVRTLSGGRDVVGALGLVRRAFIEEHGGLIEGFRGWGGEDNAWAHKARLLGRSASTTRSDQVVYHLYHEGSGAYPSGAADNPHYRANVALWQRVASTRSAADLKRLFPPGERARSELTVSETGGAPVERLTVWSYWEGPQPPWIARCLETLAAAAGTLNVLSPESFDRLRDRDRDIDLTRLSVPQRADFIRAFLLMRFGGLWVDADCVAMQSLSAVLDTASGAEFVGHRERSGLVSNGFMGARCGSRIAAALYERICRILRAREPLGWTSLGSEPLNAVLAELEDRWHELPCERIQPVCWSESNRFFVRRDRSGHEREFDQAALCYMLSHSRIAAHMRVHASEDLLALDSFFSFLIEHAPRSPAAPASVFASMFGEHVRLYRRCRSESLSGPGSSLEQTRELRQRLPLLLSHLDVRSLLDAPCGDFHWMRNVALGYLDYIGVDVQADIIAGNRALYENRRRRFMCLDLATAPLPRVDVVLCRDLLPHLSFAQIAAVLENFRRSGATYLITTNFPARTQNRDTAGAEWRTLNLCAWPFRFPPPLLSVHFQSVSFELSFVSNAFSFVSNEFSFVSCAAFNAAFNLPETRSVGDGCQAASASGCAGIL